MKKKRMKVKRYKRSFSGSADRQNTLRKVLMWIVAALVLFALGWLLAKPGLDLASKLWYQHKNGGTTPPSSSTSAPSEAQSGAVTAPSEITEPATPSAATGKGTWKFCCAFFRRNTGAGGTGGETACRKRCFGRSAYAQR